MMNSRPSYPFLFITLFCVTASFAQTHYSIDLMSGYVFNLRSPLLIQEQGKDNQVLMVDTVDKIVHLKDPVVQCKNQILLCLSH